MDNEKPKDFFKDFERQMEGVKGSDHLTDQERRNINRGVESKDASSLEALARQSRELMAEQNPLGLPLIFKPGNGIAVKRSSGKIERDWKVHGFDRAGYVIVAKPIPGTGRRLEKTLLFREFYELNPPDETCRNAEYLDQYRKS